MFKRFFKAFPRVAAIACALLTGVSFAACDFGLGNTHTHEFTDAWVQGDTQHWKECSGCDEKQGAENHSYTNGVCSVCQKPEPHKHNFADTYTQGAEQHWYACSGCDEKKDAEDHTYVNGVCKCGKADPNAPKKYSFPTSVDFGWNVGVHDPSIFMDPKDGKYYAFGSHFAVASSDDLIHWTQEVNDGKFQKLYGNETCTNNGVTWPKALQSTIDRVNPSGGSDPINSTWAPDVEYHDGKYYMYYSLTKAFGSRESAIARVEADNVLGPYSNNQILLDSMQGSGTAPNCIDPELFYDKDGGLWMVYGSFFGGIYIKELYNEGANWGLPKESGFGKLLWKGGSSGAEGPYIFRNGNYYYLMVSDGSLLTNYNMRIARSTSPDGPYYDISGADMAAAYGKGNKLAGNWKFEGEQGKAAYGHNSVCEIDGEFFVIAHMRYEENSGDVTLGHNIRVHRLLFNEQSWPVLATERYAGETLGVIEESEIIGSFDLILHSEGIPQTFVSSERFTFTPNHQITKDGTNRGTWSYKESGNFIEITLDGVTYKGTAMPVWKDNGGTIALSAVSNTGRSLWANGVPAPQAPNLNIVKQVDGAAKNTVVAAFNATGGFTVSFRVNNVTDDWHAVVVDINGMSITLPNLDTAFNTVEFPKGNCYPLSANANQAGFDYDCYMNTSCYVTISVSKTNGVLFFKNGVLTQKYLPSASINGTAENVQGFTNKLLELIATEGFNFVPNTFANGDNTIGSASDLIISLGAADAATALAIYNYYG